MNNLKNSLLLSDNIFLKYNINIGFFDNKKKCFNNYITQKNFFNIKKKFSNYKYKKYNTIEYKFLDKVKVHSKNSNKNNYFKYNISNYFYLKNNESSKEDLNYAYLKFKENNNSFINCVDFPNIETTILKKFITKYYINLKNILIIIYFEQINDNYYNINIKLEFDRKIIDEAILNLINILNLIYSDNINLEKI